MNINIFGITPTYVLEDNGVVSAVFNDMPRECVPPALFASTCGPLTKLNGCVDSMTVSALAYPSENGLQYRRVVASFTESAVVVH